MRKIERPAAPNEKRPRSFSDATFFFFLSTFFPNVPRTPFVPSSFPIGERIDGGAPKERALRRSSNAKNSRETNDSGEIPGREARSTVGLSENGRRRRNDAVDPPTKGKTATGRRRNASSRKRRRSSAREKTTSRNVVSTRRERLPTRLDGSAPFVRRSKRSSKRRSRSALDANERISRVPSRPPPAIRVASARTVDDRDVESDPRPKEAEPKKEGKPGNVSRRTVRRRIERNLAGRDRSRRRVSPKNDGEPKAVAVSENDANDATKRSTRNAEPRVERRNRRRFERISSPKRDRLSLVPTRVSLRKYAESSAARKTRKFFSFAVFADASRGSRRVFSKNRFPPFRAVKKTIK